LVVGFPEQKSDVRASRKRMTRSIVENVAESRKRKLVFEERKETQLSRECGMGPVFVTRGMRK